MLAIEGLIAFTLVFAIDSVSPGPAAAAVVARGAATGLRRTLPFIAGLVIGDLVLFALAVAGLAALAQALGPLFTVVKWLGVAYLLYLAWKLWHAAPTTAAAEAPRGEGRRLLVLGSVLPLGNPKAIGFYVALLPSVLDVSALSLGACLTLAVVIVLVWSLVLGGYAVAAERAGRLFTTPRAQVWINRTAAGAMAGAAGTIAARS